MGLIEAILLFLIGTSAGYYTGQANQRVDAVEQGQICFDADFDKRKAGCYSVEPQLTEDSQTSAGN